MCARMRIRFAPARGTPEIELRDIAGGSPFAKWTVGEEREVSGTVKYRKLGVLVDMDAAEAIFRHGPDFVDAATGTNPFYTCKRCGAVTLDQFIILWRNFGPEKVSFVDDAGNPLCVSDYLADHPEHIVEFRFRGISADVLSRAQSIITQRSQTASKPAAVAAPADHDEETS